LFRRFSSVCFPRKFCGNFGCLDISVGADLYLGGHEDADGDDDLRSEFLCPFCAEDYDVVGLCCHIDEEHPVEAKNGVSIFFRLMLY